MCKGYTTDVLQDSLIYAEHANKTDIDLDDIQLAIQGRVNHSFTTPPPKEFLLELAQEKNKAPLPLIPEKYGIRLPADKHCLTGINFSIVPDVNINKSFLNVVFTSKHRLHQNSQQPALLLSTQSIRKIWKYHIHHLSAEEMKMMIMIFNLYYFCGK